MSMQDTKPNIYETTTFLGGTSETYLFWKKLT